MFLLLIISNEDNIFPVEQVGNKIYIHDNKIIRKNLKTSSIFLYAKNHVKINDFGMASIIDIDKEKVHILLNLVY